MRCLAIAALSMLAASGCSRAEGDEPRSWFSRGADRAVTVSAGDAELDASGLLNFEITSDTYRRWTAAKQALGRSPVARSVAQLGRRALTQDELDAAVARVQRDGTARAAIEGAGMTPLEYVYASVAIEQAMAVASGRLAARKDGGAAARNAEIAAQHRDGLPPGDMIADSTPMVLPEELAPAPPVPETIPVPVPEPAPAEPSLPLPPTGMPRPEPVPTPPSTPMPAPVPTPDPQPSPVPEPSPVPQSSPVPEPKPSAPPAGTPEPQASPAPPPGW